MQQAKDFYDESECLKELVLTLEDKELKTETLFKSWTINQTPGRFETKTPGVFLTFLELARIVEPFKVGLSLVYFILKRGGGF